MSIKKCINFEKIVDCITSNYTVSREILRNIFFNSEECKQKGGARETS